MSKLSEERAARKAAELAQAHAPAVAPEDDPALNREAAFAGFAQPESPEQLAEFQALPEGAPFRREGRDFYVDPDGGLHSAPAGFDPSADFPDYVPATAEQVAARDAEKLQARKGSLGDRLDTAVETGAAAVAGAGEWLSDRFQNPLAVVNPFRYELNPAHVDAEKLAPFAFSAEAEERREANPKTALAAGIGADIGTMALTRRLPGFGGAVARNLLSSAIGAGADSAVTGEPVTMPNVLHYGVINEAFEAVQLVPWADAMRAAGRKGRSFLERSVETAKGGSVAEALAEKDPIRRTTLLRQNAEAIYEKSQNELDQHLAAIDERMEASPERLFTPGVLKRTVSENLTAQAENVADIQRRLNAAAEVTGHVQARAAAEALGEAAGKSGPELFAALRRARQALTETVEGEASALLGQAEHSPLVQEAATALDGSLGNESLWGRAAKNHSALSGAAAGSTPKVAVQDVAAREALDQRLTAARARATLTGDKPLAAAIKGAEAALAEADAVTGARLMGPVGPVKAALVNAAKNKATRLVGDHVGNLAGAVIGGALGGVPGALGGAVVGKVVGDVAAPYVARAIDKLAGIGAKHGGKLSAAALIGGGALAASADEGDGDTAAAGLGLLAVPILLGAGGRKLGLLDAMRELAPKLEAAKKPGRDWLDWGTKEKVLTEVFGDAEHPAAKLADDALERLRHQRIPLSASDKEIEYALERSTSGVIKDSVQRARKAFSVEQGLATKAARKAGSPQATAARELLGPTGSGLEEPFRGEWKKTDWRGNSIATYSGDTVGEVLKKRLADKAPLSMGELAEEVIGNVPGAGRGSYTEAVPRDAHGDLDVYGEWADRARAWHAETHQLERAKYAALEKKVAAAVEGLGPDASQAAKVAAEDAVLRGTIRDALGMKPPKTRELPTNVNATSRYRKNKKGFDAWAQAALDEEQRAALRDWQSRWYRMINADARGTLEETTRFYKEESWFDSEHIERQLEKTPQIASNLIAAMNTAIEAGHTVPGIVTRGISMPAEEVERLVNAKTVTSQGFMSTSIHSTTPEGFATRRAAEYKEVPVMLTVEQKTGVPIGQGEGEITLRPGTKFSVEWVQPANETDGVVTAYLKEIEPSKLTPKDVLAGIAGKIPTEAKVAAGLLAVDAATSDDGEPGGVSAAGVGALALLFGGAKRMRGIQSRLAVAGKELGAFTQTVDRVMNKNAKTILQVAEWGKTADRRPLQEAVQNLKRSIEGKIAEADAANGEAMWARSYDKVRTYLDAAIEERLAQAAGAGQLGKTSAAPKVEALIEEFSKKSHPYEGHPVVELFPPNAGDLRQKNVVRTEKELFATEGGNDAVRRINYVMGNTDGIVRRWVKNALESNAAEQGLDPIENLRLAFDQEIATLKKQVQMLKGTPKDPKWGLVGQSKLAEQADKADASFPELTEQELYHLDSMLAREIGNRVEQVVTEAELYQGGRVPARGLELRAALRSYTHDPDLAEGLARSLDEKTYLDVAPEDHEAARRYHAHNVEQRRTQFVQNLVNYNIPKPTAQAVVDDLLAAVQQGRPFEAAVDDVATVLDMHAELLPMSKADQRRAAEVYEKWSGEASQRYGFSISRAIDDYAGDFDYKNINAYARGLLGGKRSPAQQVMEEVELGNFPSHGQLQALVKQASALGEDDVVHWALKLDELGDHDTLEALTNALKEGNIDTSSAGMLHSGHAADKANKLQHALDLAVSDGVTAPGVTYRGALLSDADLARIAEADEVEAWAFMSTTAEPDYAARFIKNKKLLDADPSLNQVLFEVVQRTGVPINPGEGEVLLRAGTRFRVEKIEAPVAADRMHAETATKVRFRLVELDHEPKLPTMIGEKGTLPWVAGGVLAIGAGSALESDANAAEPEPVIPTEEADPEQVMRDHATHSKLEYVTSQARSLMTATARALVTPAQKDRRVPIAPGLTQSVGVAAFAGRNATLRGAYEEKKATLQLLQRDPMALVNEMADGLADISHASPDLHREIVAQTYKVVAFLQGKLPGTIGASLVRPDGTPPSDTALRQFALYYSAATNPSSVLNDLANNRARKEQVDTLKELWPDKYQELKLAALDQLASSGSRPTLNQRTRLDLLFDFGESLDKALSPRIVQARAEFLAQADPSKATAAPSRRTQPSITGTSPLSRLSQGTAAA